MPKELRVLVVAGDTLARAGLAALVTGQTGFSVAGQTSGGGTLLEDVDFYQPDIIVWDLGLDDTASLEQIANLPEIGLPIVALVADDEAAQRVAPYRPSGVLSRDVAGTTLGAAMQAVAAGLVTVAAQFAGTIRSRRTPLAPPTEPLTPRELEILQLLAQGIPNKAIAARLGISDHTVKFHVSALMAKLDTQNRTETVARGTRLGLVQL